MSDEKDIILQYDFKQYKIKEPQDFSELENKFFEQSGEDKNILFSFYYYDEDKEKCYLDKNTEKSDFIISIEDLQQSGNPIIFIEKKEKEKKIKNEDEEELSRNLKNFEEINTISKTYTNDLINLEIKTEEKDNITIKKKEKKNEEEEDDDDEEEEKEKEEENKNEQNTMKSGTIFSQKKEKEANIILKKDEKENEDSDESEAVNSEEEQNEKDKNDLDTMKSGTIFSKKNNNNINN